MRREFPLWYYGFGLAGAQLLAQFAKRGYPTDPDQTTMFFKGTVRLIKDLRVATGYPKLRNPILRFNIYGEIVAMYNNYCGSRLIGDREDEVIKILQKELEIDISPLWYFDAGERLN